jgi:uncharacterized membrane protein YfcA
MEIALEQLILLCLVSFAAGFVDAIVGGGGLIQTPATIVVLNAYPVVNAIATVKLPSFSGTVFAAVQYLRKVKLDISLSVMMCTIAFFSSFTGSQLLSLVRNDFMKPVLLVVLTVVAIYTYTKKDFGQQQVRQHSRKQQFIYAAVISLVIGFYDGFIGPGTGSFLMLAGVALLGYDFLHASAQAKLVNLATNLGSIVLFTIKGKIIWPVALPMAASNAIGGLLGARLAIAKGNKFIRIFFLFVVIVTLLRFAWDVLMK